MRIYVFAEHYPNPFKPYYDAQLAQFLDDGHALRIFTFGKHDTVRNATVREYGLDRRTRYLPWTLRHLPAALPGLAVEAARRPRAVSRCVAASWDPEQSPKRSLLDAARALCLPEEAPDLCLVHNLVTAQFFAFLERLYPTARVALYFHGGELPDGRPISRAEAARVFRHTHRVFTNTAFSRAQLVERGCPPEKVALCPVGFRLSDYRPASRRRYRRSGVLRVITVGRASVEKGLDYALDAASLLKRRGEGRFHLRIIGAGTALESLERQAQLAGLAPQVEFRGELPHHQLLREYREADVLLLPSIPTEHWEENQACVMQEAMLMQLPVIASRTGGVLESLAPALHRLSVEPRDVEGIARRITQLLRMDEQSLRTLGAAGRTFARDRYDVRRLNRQLIREAMEGVSPETRQDALPA